MYLVGRSVLISLFIAVLLASSAVLAQENEQQALSLPEDCFDTANTAESCQILFHYAELFGFSNIPDYVGFVESILDETRGEAPYLPLRETEEFKRFRAIYEAGKQPTDEMYQEINLFMIQRQAEVTEFRHAQDWVSLLAQEAFFERLMRFNSQLLPQLDDLAAIETTFLQAHPKLPQVLAELRPLLDGQSILAQGALGEEEETPQALTWLTTLYGLTDEYQTERLILNLVTLDQAGGVAFDLPRLDQRPAIGAIINTPVDTPIVITEALRADISQIEQSQLVSTGNALQDIHFYEPFRVNNLLALLTFAEGMGTELPRIPYARSVSLIEARYYVGAEVLAQINNQSDDLMNQDHHVIAAILALRLGVNIPVLGSSMVQLEDADNGDFIVVELNPMIGRLVYMQSSGDANNATAEQND